MEVLLNDVSESCESSDSGWTESPEIAVISDVTDEVTPKTLPSYCLGLSAISMLS
jgi:hypothetical protein